MRKWKHEQRRRRRIMAMITSETELKAEFEFKRMLPYLIQSHLNRQMILGEELYGLQSKLAAARSTITQLEDEIKHLNYRLDNDHARR